MQSNPPQAVAWFHSYWNNLGDSHAIYLNATLVLLLKFHNKRDRVGVRIVLVSPQGWFLSHASNNVTVAVKLLCKHSSWESLSQDSWYITSKCWPGSWQGEEETPSPHTAQNSEEAVQPSRPTWKFLFSKAPQPQSTVIISPLMVKALHQGGKVAYSQPMAATAAPGIFWLILWQASKPRIIQPQPFPQPYLLYPLLFFTTLISSSSILLWPERAGREGMSITSHL